MTKLHNLPKSVDSTKKRVGRGKGSNRGKTSGRGMKGQRARGKVRVGFEGGQTSLVRRLPTIRGYGFTGKHQGLVEVNLAMIDRVYEKGETVSLTTLKEKRLISRKARRVKVLGRGKLTKALEFMDQLQFSKVAAEKIAQVGRAADAQKPKTTTSRKKATRKSQTKAPAKS